ncbi:TREM2 protein, partial [Psilopogon haemacephalus]|nr:TREM2 protein [Psilopogon haemacephalus]
AGCVSENITVVYGTEGGSISVNCSYKPQQHLWREKSWCRQEEQSQQCQQVVSIRRFLLPFLRKWNGSTSIRDDIYAGILTITIRQLRKQDAGLYQCKTHGLGGTKSLGKVRVEVLPGRVHQPHLAAFMLPHSLPAAAADFTAFYSFAGFLLAKFVVAVLIFAIVSSRRQRAAEQQDPGLQDLPFAAAPAAHGSSPSWQSTA